MDQEHPQVGVTALADAAESPDAAARGLARAEPQVGGEVAPGGKALDVGDEGDESRGGERADSR